jgi:hypothetical protein
VVGAIRQAGRSGRAAAVWLRASRLAGGRRLAHHLGGMSDTRRSKLPRLVRHCLPALAAGTVAGVIAAGALVASDVGGLRGLILHDRQGWIALFLMVFGFVVTFGSLAIGGAVMALGREGE